MERRHTVILLLGVIVNLEKPSLVANDLVEAGLRFDIIHEELYKDSRLTLVDNNINEVAKVIREGIAGDEQAALSAFYQVLHGILGRFGAEGKRSGRSYDQRRLLSSVIVRSSSDERIDLQRLLFGQSGISLPDRSHGVSGASQSIMLDSA